MRAPGAGPPPPPAAHKQHLAGAGGAPPRPPSSPPEPKVFPDARREAQSIWASCWERQRRGGGAWRPRLGGTQAFGAMRSGKGGEWKRQHRNPLGSGEAAYLTFGAPGLRESDSTRKPTEAPGWGSVRYMDKPSKFPSCLARAPSRAVSGVQGPPVAAAPILAHGTHPRPRPAQTVWVRTPPQQSVKHATENVPRPGGSRSSLPAPPTQSLGPWVEEHRSAHLPRVCPLAPWTCRASATLCGAAWHPRPPPTRCQDLCTCDNHEVITQRPPG